MYSIKQLDTMQQVDLKQIDKDKLIDARTVQINTDLPKHQRMDHYLSQIGNPYCFRVGDTAVKVEFADTDSTLQHTLARFLSRKAAE